MLEAVTYFLCIFFAMVFLFYLIPFLVMLCAKAWTYGRKQAELNFEQDHLKGLHHDHEKTTNDQG